MGRKPEASIYSAPVLHVLVVMVLGLLAYSNTFHAPFLFDDYHNIAENPIIKDLKYFVSPSEAEGFAQYESLRVRFVGYLSFFLNYSLHGLDVTGFHIVNLLIHLLSALMVYLMVRVCFRTPRLEGSRLEGLSPYIALSAALLFISHPIQTQAVTYIVQRFASLAALFYLSAVVAYTGARLVAAKKARAGLYVSALILTLLAMKTKENAFTLPLALVLFESTFFRSTWKERLIWLAPFILTMAIIPFSYLGVVPGNATIIEQLGDLTVIQNIPRSHYLMTELRVLMTYLRLIVLPMDQNLYYDYPVYSSFLDPKVFLSLMALLALLTAGVYLAARPPRDEPAFRMVGYGVIWFFLAHAVESSLVPLHVIFEHRMYLPSAGLFIAISVFGAYISHRFKHARRPVLAAMLIVPLVFCGATFARNQIWRSEVAFWEDVVQKSSSNSAAYTNLANAYKVQGEMEKARQSLEKALELDPSNEVSHNQLGLLYEVEGDIEAAVSEYVRAIEIDPDFIQARNNLGKVYIEQGQYKVAIDHYKQSLALSPDNPIALSNMGFAHKELGEYDKAIELFQKAIQLDPDLANAYVHLGNTYVQKGRIDLAVDSFNHALEAEPANTIARFNLANAYMRMEEHKRAALEFTRLARKTPLDPKVQFALGAAWFNTKEFDRAIPALREAIRLDRTFDRPYLVLALAYEKEGLLSEAQATYEALLEIHPGHPAAIQGLVKLGVR